MKIYGLFRYIRGTTKKWILVMGNSFPPHVKIDVAFDLKGRVAKKGKSVSERGVISQGVLKDNEIDRYPFTPFFSSPFPFLTVAERFVGKSSQSKISTWTR